MISNFILVSGDPPTQWN